MNADRRAFLGILGGSFVFALAQPLRARAQSGALDVHRGTRNTLRGAVGARLRQLGRRPASRKTYPGVPHFTLPPLPDDPSLPLAAAVRSYAPAMGFQKSALSLAELGRILEGANGVTGRRGEVQLRAAPSAGALYAGEVYAAVDGVDGLPPGVYYYAAAERTLHQVKSGSPADALARATERPGEVADASAVVLLTNVFRRYNWRYANRGYRYALIDSGHIGENLRLTAHSAGIAERPIPRFEDDRLNRLLGVDGVEEAVCAVHALGRPAEEAVSTAAARRFAEKRSASGTGIRGPIVRRYHEATKLVEREAALVRSGDHATPSTGRFSLALPEPSTPEASVEAVIRQRRSAMHFAREDIPRESLSFVLEMARAHDRLERAAGVDLYVVVHRVDGLAPGLYRYETSGHGLAVVREADFSGPMTDACLGQEKAGSAAVGLVMVGRLIGAAAREGERSYRDLLIESGAIGQRVYLGAEAVGLSARNLAAFVDDELNALLGLDGRNTAVMHLTMLGRDA